MSHKPLYKTLGIAEDATADQIKKAYRALARKHHPDKNQGDKQAEDNFKRINHAFEVLSDPQKRALYDELGDEAEKLNFDPERVAAYRQASQGFGAGAKPRGAGGKGGVGIDFEQIFGPGFRAYRGEGFPGGFPQPGPQAGDDLNASLHVSFEDAVLGAEREIGLGGDDTRIKVKIPAGVRTGQRIRLRGQGLQGERGGPAGDLFIAVTVGEHPFMKRDSDDLILDLPVTLREIMLGSEVQIPTLEGKVKLKIPAGSQNGAKLRIKGKGVQRKGHPGDLYARLVVKLPDVSKDPERLKAAIDALEALYGEDVRKDLY